MRYFVFLITCLLLLSFNSHARNAVVKRVTNDVIVVSPEKKQLQSLGWPNNIINSIAVKTKEGIILIDTQNSPANASLIKKRVTQSFNDTTFAYIINTHGHSCHSGGNCMFNDQKIVAHTNSTGEIKNYDDIFLGQSVEFLRKKIYHKTNILDTIKIDNNITDSINEAIDLYRFYEDDLINNYEVRYPDLTFDDQLTLTAGNKTVELTYMGKGHGDADITVYIKEDKVLCTGNLFHLGSYDAEEMPSFYVNRPNDIQHWIASLDIILEKDIKYVISTHGKRLFSKNNIEFIRDYCVAVNEEVKKAKSSQISMESLQQTSHFRSVFRKYDGLVNANVQKMHARNIAIIWKQAK